MEYKVLSAEDQKGMLEARLRQYEADHFAQSTTRDLLIASGAQDAETKRQIQIAEETMTTLDKAHADVVERLELYGSGR